MSNLFCVPVSFIQETFLNFNCKARFTSLDKSSLSAQLQVHSTQNKIVHWLVLQLRPVVFSVLLMIFLSMI